MANFAVKRSPAQRSILPRAIQGNMASAGEAVHSHGWRDLQRAIGNQALQWMLKADSLKVRTSDALSSDMGSDFSPSTGTPLSPVRNQTELAINEPDDQFEREAESVSEQVMRTPAPEDVGSPPALQRKCASCEDEPQVSLSHRTGSAGTASRSVPANFLSSIGPGHVLDAATRAFFEPRFGQDFSGVRVHADTQAAEAARAVNARAFTVGRDVVFDSGEFSPGTSSGRRLLAHELAHVGQQTGAARGSGSASGAAMLQRDARTLAGGNFTPADYANLLKKKKDLKIAADSSWVPQKLQDNILAMLRFALDAKRSPSATEGINIKDFYHGHIAVPEKPGLSIDAEESRSKERKKIVEASEKVLGGEYENVTEANFKAYKKEIDKILPDFAKAVEEGLKIKGAVVVYHTFEMTVPGDLEKANKGLSPEDPRRNYVSPLDTNAPSSFTPPADNLGMPSGFMLYLGFEFLVSADGAVHVRLGTFTQLSTTTDTPFN